MEGKGLICGLPAKNVVPKFRQQIQQQAKNDQQTDADDELKEITKIDFRRACAHRGYLIRIEEDIDTRMELEEEDIEAIRKLCARNNTDKKRPREEKGESSYCKTG
ncbi:unnamed protein product [Arabidopsis lyrata]|nr:unnamed protein product [Arabidopsis lyrata]